MELYRKTLLFFQGLIYDTKNGYNCASRTFIAEDLNVDLNHLTFLITGANSGIGYETAKAIAARGGTVHMVCRNGERANRAKTEIVQETGNEKLHVHILDMSRVKDVYEFVKRFISEHGKLDVLINNAGEMCLQYTKTETENLEKNFATNVAGPYVLTEGLLDLLKKSSNEPRVVNVGSAGMLIQRLNVKYFEQNPSKFDGILAYSQCKRQMAVLTEHWSHNHPDIFFACMHPGWVDTPAAKRGLGEFYEKMKNKFRDPCAGADTVIWLAISKWCLEAENGSYFQDREVTSKHLPLARTKETESQKTEFLKYLKNSLLRNGCLRVKS